MYYFTAVVCLSPSIAFQKKTKKHQKNADHKQPVLQQAACNRGPFGVSASCKHSRYHGGILQTPRLLLSCGSWFICSGRKLFGCCRVLQGPSHSQGRAAYRHQPPHKVICVRVFILGAQLWRIELCGPQDLQNPIKSLSHRHGTALLSSINDVDNLDIEKNISIYIIIFGNLNFKYKTNIQCYENDKQL